VADQQSFEVRRHAPDGSTTYSSLSNYLAANSADVE
jgi:hypothetical protein